MYLNLSPLFLNAILFLGNLIFQIILITNLIIFIVILNLLITLKRLELDRLKDSIGWVSIPILGCDSLFVIC